MNRCTTRLAVGLILLMGPVLSHAADDAPAPTGPALLSAEQIQAKIQAAQATADLPEAVRNAIVQQYEQANAHLLRLKSIEQATRQMQDLARQAPQRISQLKTDTAQPPAELPDPARLADSLSLEQIEQRYRQQQALLEQARRQLKDLSDKVAFREKRATEIPGELEATRQALAEVKQQLDAPAPADEPPLATEARRTALLCRQVMLNAQLAQLEQEQGQQELLLQLCKAEHDQAQRKLALLDANVQAWQQALTARRKAQAQQDVQQAQTTEQHTRHLPASFNELARQNTELARRRETLIARLDRLAEQKKQAADLLKNLDEQFEQTRQYVRQAGLDETVGLLLRSQRDGLPDLAAYRSAMAGRQEEIRTANAMRFSLDQNRKALTDLEAQVRTLLSQLSPAPAGEDRAYLADQARRLLTSRRQYLDQLYDTYSQYLQGLRDLDSLQRQLQSRVQEFRRFIDANLMWSRSAPPLGRATLTQAGKAIAWLVSPAQWRQAVRLWARQLAGQPVRWGLLALLWLALVLLEVNSRHRLGLIAERVGRVRQDSMTLTLEALGLTVLRSATWPGLLALVGLAAWQAGSGSRVFVAGLGLAAMGTAACWTVLRLFGLCCIPAGLARVHFRWPEPVCRSIRYHLGWLVVVVLPLIAVTVLVSTCQPGSFGGSLDRLCFIVISLSLAVAVACLLRPRGSLVNALRRAQADGPVKAWWLWYPLAVAVPAVPVLLSVMGYDYAAYRLLYRLFVTGVVALGLFVMGQALLVRWLLVTHRRLAYEQALQKREELRRQRQQAESTDAGQATATAQAKESAGIEEPVVDLAQIAQDSRRLIGWLTGFAFLLSLWFIWSPVLPALAFLNDVHVWTYTTEIDGVARQMPITLANLILAVLVVVVTIIATRNLPGVLEMVLLKRLPLDAGLRYAITALSRYTLIGIGLVLAVRLIGIGWSDVQWLVAALGVGIGFGLQEIVANFISGLILLFERPIRVGDIVEVGDVMGVVSRIRIRATTITNWDRKEYIVPNKDFITGRLLNWTLSNKVNRIVINVGVAYGSDVEQVRAILQRITDEHPLILKDPRTLVTFEGFGDNSLNFVIRTYLPDFENRLEVVHQLHRTIYEQLNQAGIAIAFPQRDVHLDAVRPLEVRIVGQPPARPDPPGQPT